MLRVIAVLKGLVDLTSGGLAVCWPAAWHELVHPEVLPPALFTWQALGALWLMTGLWALATARRPTQARSSGLVALCVVEIPAALLMAWRTSATGPWTGVVYVCRAALATGVAIWAWRKARPR